MPIIRNRPTAGAVRVTQSVSAVKAAVRRAELGLTLIGAIVLALELLQALRVDLELFLHRPLARACARALARGERGGCLELSQRLLYLFTSPRDRGRDLCLYGRRRELWDRAHQSAVR